jgi:prepilin-type N-terminal cleavage/methylation domain-containing protein
MKKGWNILQDQKGFSLIEVIIFLILAGILSVVYVNYMGASLQYSADPVNMVRDEASVETLMERITSDYVKLVNGTATYTNAVATVFATNYGANVTKSYVDHDTFLTAGTIAAAGGPGTDDKANPLLIVIQAHGNTLSALFTKERFSEGDPIAHY